ncbi:MAG: GNAT family N-acetyltransferase [Rhodobacterales bacterium]|nr:GNAT family N-acetyltransferase [Rhodobacterales bacterium]
MDQEITIKHLGPDDLELLLAVPEGLFDDPVDAVQAADFLADPMHEIMLAYDGDLAVGMVTGTVVLHPDKPPSMFVNELGTREGWIRRGIARDLAERFFDLARARGCEGIWLGTEPDNLPALGLYRSLGGQEITFVGFGWDGAFEDE